MGVNADGKVEGIQSERRQAFSKSHLDAAVKMYTKSSLPFPLAKLVIGAAKPVHERSIVEHVIALSVALHPLEIEDSFSATSPWSLHSGMSPPQELKPARPQPRTDFTIYSKSHRRRRDPPSTRYD